ncbi:MAG: hypothetical protein M1836_001495 [Candelina mexicana]|nr:MAG: hypothetical protein M1836_001495 [Candelina mexicana]
MPADSQQMVYVEAQSTGDAIPKPPKRNDQRLESHNRHKTPSWFWDKLSRQWLTSRTLREFDRRTVRPTIPVSHVRDSRKSINEAKLKLFARRGGPELDSLRGYPERGSTAYSRRAMSSSQIEPRKRVKTGVELDITSKTKKSSAYDPSFEQHLIDHGIYPDGYDENETLEEPANMHEINCQLVQHRQSLSPTSFSREHFLAFKKTNREALTEETVMSKVFPIITGSARIAHSENLQFGNLKDLTDGSISKAKPDFYDGTRPAQLNKRIRADLGPFIMPSINTTAPCLPNFFTEGKGPNGNMAVCKRQALYNGALGARGIQELRTYIDQETSCDNRAYTITTTYHSGTGDLTIYSTHPTQTNQPQNRIEYRTTQLRGFKMTDTAETFRQGACALRNAREWASAQRQELIIAANEKVNNADNLGLDNLGYETSTENLEATLTNSEWGHNPGTRSRIGSLLG